MGIQNHYSVSGRKNGPMDVVIQDGYAREIAMEEIKSKVFASVRNRLDRDWWDGLVVYIKPNEGMAYYVADNVAGQVPLWT